MIIAETTSTDGTIQTATATFSCPRFCLLLSSQTPGSATRVRLRLPRLLETLTVYNEGLNTTNWLVTAPSATGTPNVIHCGPGWAANGTRAARFARRPIPPAPPLSSPRPLNRESPSVDGLIIARRAMQACTPLPGPVYWTAAGPNYCVVSLSSNDTVGAIFN